MAAPITDAQAQAAVDAFWKALATGQNVKYAAAIRAAIATFTNKQHTDAQVTALEMAFFENLGKPGQEDTLAAMRAVLGKA